MARKICVVGMGYVGTTLGITLAEAGFHVTGVEIKESVRNMLKNAVPHFHEKGLSKLLKKHVGKRLTITDRIDSEADTYVICVTTPVDENKNPVMKFVEHASKEVGSCVMKGDLVVLRSTVPIGTTRNIVMPIIESTSGLKVGDFHVAYAPERTIEGKALEELRELPQIIGGYNEDCSVIASNMFMKITPTIVNVSSLEAAEIIKLLDNTHRDVGFAYSNEIALICEHLGLSAAEVIKAANMGYKRNNIPLPSPGVGGACLTKDPYILYEAARNHGYDAKLLKLARDINEHMPRHVVGRVKNYFRMLGKEIDGSKVFVVGFAFKGKPETSDTRDSTTIPIVKGLLEAGASVYGFDPVVPKEEIESFGAKHATIERGFDGADCIIFANNHDSYRDVDFDTLLEKTSRPCVFIDSWNALNYHEITGKDHVLYGGVGWHQR